MAKDAKGHGSEKRGGADMSNPLNSNQHKVLTDTLKMPSAMAGVMGGPSQAEAEATLRGKFGYGDKDIAALTGKGIGGVSGAVRANPNMGNKARVADTQARLTAARSNPDHPLGALTNAVSGAVARGATPIAGVDGQAAAKLAEGGAPGKNTTVPVHSGASGRSDDAVPYTSRTPSMRDRDMGGEGNPTAANPHGIRMGYSKA